MKKPVKSMEGFGRVTIPVEIRNELSLRKGDPIRIYTARGKVVIEPTNQDSVCQFCGHKNELGSNFCSECGRPFNLEKEEL